jgi:hypothetical protein
MARLVVGVNDLATTHPELAAELVDQTLATQLNAGSNKKVDWCCKAHGHLWAAVVGNRALKGSGCSVCSGRTVLAGFNDLATLRPDLAAELVDQTLATQLSPGTHRKVQWWCNAEGHVWTAVVKSRAGGRGCPTCTNRVVLPGFNDLATLRPDLAAELVDQTLATQLGIGSNKKAEWRCKAHGHVWVTTVNGRVSAGRGCPYCAGQLVLPGFNDLATLRPDLAAELVDQTLATQLSSSSNKKAEWRCKAATHVWITTVNGRSAGNGCPYCAGQLVLPGFNDLATLRPDLAAELVDQTLATQLSLGTHRKVQWWCNAQGHAWTAGVADRSFGNGCPYCAGQLVLPGFNDLATLRPDLAAELVDQTLATQLGIGTEKKAEWRCKAHGHVWTATVNNRTLRNSGCPVCWGRTVLPGFNDLATLRPDLAAELVDQTLATQLGIGSNKKAEWRCKQGHTWRAVVASRSSGTGCSECATTGFSQVGIGWLYLLATPGRRVFKFGITNDLETRLDKHYRQGFTEVVEEFLFDYGGDALKIETALLRHKKAMGWEDGMTKADMPDGYSETLLADDCGHDFTLTGFIATLPPDHD